jgi:serine/threonine protein kinase
MDVSLENLLLTQDKVHIRVCVCMCEKERERECVCMHGREHAYMSTYAYAPTQVLKLCDFGLSFDLGADTKASSSYSSSRYPVQCGVVYIVVQYKINFSSPLFYPLLWFPVPSGLVTEATSAHHSQGVAKFGNSICPHVYVYVCVCARLSRTHRLLGRYMAPEVFRGDPDCDPRLADVYSAGVVLWLMLFSDYPYQLPSAGASASACVYVCVRERERNAHVRVPLCVRVPSDDVRFACIMKGGIRQVAGEGDAVSI